MKQKIELSILDFGYRNNPEYIDAISNIINYTIEAEQLNFKRIWFAEHHNTLSTQTYLNPDILISLIAGSTDSIRVGSAGCLVGYHPAYDTAANYKFLNNIYNDRIDLGLAKGRPGNYTFHNFFESNTSEHVSRTTQNTQDIIDLYGKEEHYLNNHKIILPPYGGIPPQLWYFSNSYRNLDYCLENNLNFCRSLIHGKNMLDAPSHKEEIDKYRDSYYSKYEKEPNISIAIAVSFSLSEDEIKIYEEQNADNPEIFTITHVNEESFKNLTQHIQNHYGVHDIVIFDVENDDYRRIENLHKMSKALQP